MRSRTSLAPARCLALCRRPVVLLRTAHAGAGAHAVLSRARGARLAGLATELRAARAELLAAAAEPAQGAPAAPGAAPAGGSAQQQRRARRASQAPAAAAPALQAVRAPCPASVQHRCYKHELPISLSRGLAARACAEARAPERGG